MTQLDIFGQEHQQASRKTKDPRPFGLSHEQIRTALEGAAGNHLAVMGALATTVIRVDEDLDHHTKLPAADEAAVLHLMECGLLAEGETVSLRQGAVRRSVDLLCLTRKGKNLYQRWAPLAKGRN
ncbi:hypothetical protein [Actinoalloteichus hymeniacidonis]|uniref:Uncharacterized protein n=1 Tax=Actinoalloteichus hymeniacidonis TaxID=340345 RepID=A0AAC9HLQ6_9PSEU|nr:hypothetical protein [Actinoalloteichus hymeniacidonis]AOS61496.1 hypothetical protein TL08_03320 [Actinoalloteichus hymeniacidonis]MBB5910496.1 hypothetical protein [Actinoalloteichus hymeniacidonis]